MESKAGFFSWLKWFFSRGVLKGHLQKPRLFRVEILLRYVSGW